MAKTLFVTATGTSVGKTYTALRLMEEFADIGKKAVPFKPIETGVNGYPQDASLLFTGYKRVYGDSSLTLDDICPFRFELASSVFVAKESAKIDLLAIDTKLHRLKQEADIVLMEGAGGVMSPIEIDFFMIDLGKKFADFTLLISHSGLGCINDVLLCEKALKDKKMDFEVIFNVRDDGFETISKPFLDEYLDGIKTVQNLKETVCRL